MLRAGIAAQRETEIYSNSKFIEIDYVVCGIRSGVAKIFFVQSSEWSRACVRSLTLGN